MLTRDRDGTANLSGLRLSELIGRRAGAHIVQTPVYVYALDSIVREAKSLRASFGDAPHLIAYAVKANSAGPILSALFAAGCGAEVVSGGELELCMRLGAAADHIFFSGVAKLNSELDRAISAGNRGVRGIQMESVEEIARVNARAKAIGRKARLVFRINPSVEAETHAHIATGHDEAKFGIPMRDAAQALAVVAASPFVELVGVSMHIGSQLVTTDSHRTAGDALLHVATGLEELGANLDFIDFGGGFGIDYGNGCPASPADFAKTLINKCKGTRFENRTIALEPGRSLVGAHGVLCASVVGVKTSAFEGGERRWLMLDAGMNDLIRPALYGARHRIEPLHLEAPGSAQALRYSVVGPVCESSDDFGEYEFFGVPQQVMIRDAGAYGFTMASQYNGRALPQEVFVSDGRVVDIRASRSVEQWVEERCTALI